MTWLAIAGAVVIGAIVIAAAVFIIPWIVWMNNKSHKPPRSPGLRAS